MRGLSISNIAWPSEVRAEIYRSLSYQGVRGIEVAPTKFVSWDEIGTEKLVAERQLLAEYGLEVSSYQALYFGRPELQLLKDQKSFDLLVDHTITVAKIAQQLSDGGIGVFGAPRNRVRGDMTVRDSFSLGIERFHRLTEAVYSLGFVLVLEAAPAGYGGDFLQTTAECAAMVREVAHPGLRLHLDAGCLEMTGEDGVQLIEKNHHLLGHFHLSRPGLAPLDREAIPLHTPLIEALKASNYAGWGTIEMREAEDYRSAIDTAVQCASHSLALNH